jgi:hypothetical protein
VADGTFVMDAEALDRGILPVGRVFDGLPRASGILSPADGTIGFRGTRGAREAFMAVGNLEPVGAVEGRISLTARLLPEYETDAAELLEDEDVMRRDRGASASFDCVGGIVRLTGFLAVLDAELEEDRKSIR